MSSALYGTGIELEPGRIAGASVGEAGEFDDSLYVNWPTDLDENNIIKCLVNALNGGEDKSDVVRVEMVVNDMGFITVQQFMELQHPVLQDGVGILRINSGTLSNGASVTAIMDNGGVELQGVFSPNNVDLATRMIEATIIFAGLDRASDIIRLANN